jgi:hypothetical protein
MLRRLGSTASPAVAAARRTCMCMQQKNSNNHSNINNIRKNSKMQKKKQKKAHPDTYLQVRFSRVALCCPAPSAGPTGPVLMVAMMALSSPLVPDVECGTSETMAGTRVLAVVSYWNKHAHILTSLHSNKVCSFSCACHTHTHIYIVMAHIYPTPNIHMLIFTESCSSCGGVATRPPTILLTLPLSGTSPASLPPPPPFHSLPNSCTHRYPLSVGCLQASSLPLGVGGFLSRVHVIHIHIYTYTRARAHTHT